MAPPMPACIGQAELLFERNIEGWCWYPDAPAERALVDLVVNGRVLASTKAARMRTDLRELTGCDGYCGFIFSLGEVIAEHPGGVVIEVKERRLRQTIGRILRPQPFIAPPLEARLLQAEAALDAASGRAANVARHGIRDIAGPLCRLGQTFRHLSRGRGRPSGAPSGIGMAASLEALREIPLADLFYADRPHVSILVPRGPAARSWDGLGLDRVLALAARLLRPLGAEFLLIGDGAEPSDLLLPVRLRHLRVIQAATRSHADALNAAALSARGRWLAFAWPGRLATAGLMEACSEAAAGTFYIDAAAAQAGPPGEPGPLQRHGLMALCERALFEDCGGFDVGLDGDAMWTDFLQRASALDARIVRWQAPRMAFQPSQGMNEVAHVR